MRGGILEVLLVNAEGIRHTNLVGTPSFYVIVQCGVQVRRSKISSGAGDNAWWNEKFIFEFPWSDWKNLTHLRLTIMDTELFTDDGFVGETIIHLGGIITEGSDSGFLEVKPASYNVVLEDDTYEGQIKIGFKFMANKEVHATETKGYIAEENEPRKSKCSTFVKSWWNILCFRKQRNSKSKPKKK